MNKNYRILILNGPNLNLLGRREPMIYGSNTLSHVVQNLFQLGKELGVYVDHFQSNAEYKLIHRIHHSCNKIDFIIVNPAGLTHTSVILRDAFLGVNLPFIEVHLSNIYTRESFRRHSYFSDIAVGTICGFGVNSYYCALHMAVKYLKNISK